MTLDQTTLLLGMAVAMLFAVLGALNLLAYALFEWLGWFGASTVAFGAANRIVMAAVVVAIGTYVAAALVPWGVLS